MQRRTVAQGHHINLNAVLYSCREFGKVMLAQGKGSIINTASMLRASFE